jgi:hypothetical protein
VANQLPCTVTVNATATTITIAGIHEAIVATNLGDAVVYARTDGPAAVVAADLNYALPPAQRYPAELPTSPSGGELGKDTGTPVTVLSLIAASGTQLVHLAEARLPRRAASDEDRGVSRLRVGANLYRSGGFDEGDGRFSGDIYLDAYEYTAGTGITITGRTISLT